MNTLQSVLLLNTFLNEAVNLSYLFWKKIFFQKYPVLFNCYEIGRRLGFPLLCDNFLQKHEFSSKEDYYTYDHVLKALSDLKILFIFIGKRENCEEFKEKLKSEFEFKFDFCTLYNAGDDFGDEKYLEDFTVYDGICLYSYYGLGSRYETLIGDKLVHFVNHGGSVVIGNFANTNCAPKGTWNTESFDPINPPRITTFTDILFSGFFSLTS
eukprot:TRINITY_DN1518_c0_g1_i4.p1 TRINITY_DN1518_c0_g1~~TRINITY_DN1518_c0_g1_i4.p1  ORF type:complete len:233 (-),score=27.80 TRINITY_DN1518_c0_g1_i4:400-1032(-)